jgi:hypothetical protein
LREEKEARLKELRQRDQNAQQIRVSALFPSALFDFPCDMRICSQLHQLSSSLLVLFCARADTSQRKEEARVAKERKELAWRRDHAYDDMMTEDNLAESSNQDRDEDFLEDFM